MSVLVQELRKRCPKFGAGKKFAGVPFVVIRTEQVTGGWLVTFEREP